MRAFQKDGPKRLRNVRRETQLLRKQGHVGGGPRFAERRRTDRVRLLAEGHHA
jgi:hypothetical protein